MAGLGWAGLVWFMGGWILEGKRGSDPVLCDNTLSRHGITRRNLGGYGPCDESSPRDVRFLFFSF